MMEDFVPLVPGQVCVGADTFEPQESMDLGFTKGQKITIVRETEMMFWYIAKNEDGKVGTVPGNYLEPLDIPPSDVPPLPNKPRHLSSKSSTDSTRSTLSSTPPPAAISAADYYEHMKPDTIPKLPPKPMKHMSEEEKHMLALMEREKRKRLAKGTLVVAVAPFKSNTPGDLNFKLHDELIIIEPMKDLCWYKAHRADSVSVSGVIPLTHIRLVYMSDEEDEDVYQSPKRPGHERMYEDKNDFLSNSGWFSHGGMAMGKEAHYHCLARKANMDHDRFMTIKEAVYMLKYMSEKTFIGKARVLHEELSAHFDCFGKKLKDIRQVDDELCHHTNAAGWMVKVWPLEDGNDLDIEHAKKTVEYDALVSTEDGGITEKISFTSLESFEQFWNWLSPN